MTVTVERIPELVVPGKRLGRHVHHDSRSWAYRVARRAALASVRWSTDATAILDQGNLGSCSGNAIVGALLCGPLNTALTPAQAATLNESLAVKFYSRATQTDPYPGTYPPDDTGSDGLDVSKAAQEAGYISGYQHAMGLDDTVSALAAGPVIIGIKWYTGMDVPGPAGRVTDAGTVRGGHEVCLDELDVTNQRVWFRNSWGTGYGLRGRAWMSYACLGRLLADQGDATVPVPLSQPAPTPDPDTVLAADARAWLATPKVLPANKAMAADLQWWLNAKGL